MADERYFDYRVDVMAPSFLTSNGGAEAQTVLIGRGNLGWELISVTQDDGGKVVLIFKKSR